MCDGKHASRRDVVILSIKPKRPEYPLNVKVVPVSELLQEWDKLEAYYRGQLLKLTKSFKKQKHSHSNSATRSPTSKGKSQASKGSSPVDKKHSSSSDQFNELFGDENIFIAADPGGGGHLPRDTNNNNSSQSNRSKLLHSRSLNSLFDDDGTEQRAPSSLSHQRISRKDSFTSVNSSNSSLLVSIPVLSVGGDNFGGGGGSRWHSDDEDDEVLSESEAEDDERTNFLSVPRDNFKVQYGMKAKKRVALIQTGGSVSPRWIVPVRVIPYKPPAAQGLNGVQIQKILYHKNDSVNYASPTTTTATTPDKPPDISPSPLPPSRSSSKSTKDSPASTVSPHSLDNNNATPKSTCSSSSPNLASPKSDISKPVKPVSSPPPIVNSSSGHKLKRAAPKVEHISSGHAASLPSKTTTVGGKRRRFTDTPQPFDTALGFNFAPVTSTSSTYPFQSFGNSSSEGSRSAERETSTSTSPKKVVKDVILAKPSPSFSASPPASVFVLPAALSITDRIIKKANRPQPELIERQRRRRLESNLRKSYAMQKGDEHEQRESIDLSMKSFEMIWNVPLLSPLRSP